MRNLTIPVLFLCSSLAAIAAGQDSKPASDVNAEPAVSVPAYTNANCPVMGKPASSKLFIDTEYGRIYVCCIPCNKKIRNDPAGTYKTAYPTTVKAGNTTCPVTNEKIEAGSPTVTLQGREVALCCADCVKPAKASAQITLVKALNPKARVIGNKTCPVTGEPVNANTVVLIGDDLVSLSSQKCIEEIQKAPRQVLEKAKASVGKDTKAPASPEKGHGDHKQGDQPETKPKG